MNVWNQYSQPQARKTLHAWSGIFLMAFSLCWLTTGCSFNWQYGDASYRRSTWLGRNLSIGVPVDPFLLPEFCVDKPGHYEFSVRNLPFRILPNLVEIRSPHEPLNAPWQSVELDVALLSPRGELIVKQHVVMKRYPAGHWRYQVPLNFDNTAVNRAGPLTSYRVTVVVTRPSAAEGDRAVLSAHLIALPAYPNQAISNLPIN